MFSDHIQELWSDCIINKTFSHHGGNKNNLNFKKTALEYKIMKYLVLHCCVLFVAAKKFIEMQFD